MRTISEIFLLQYEKSKGRNDMAIFGAEPESEDLTLFVWAVYALQLLTLFTGGLSFIVAGVIAYFKYDESIGRREESHFRWQIKTLWIGLGGALLGVVLLFVFIGGFVLALTQLWIAYRVIKGGYRFSQEREISNEGLF